MRNNKLIILFSLIIIVICTFMVHLNKENVSEIDSVKSSVNTEESIDTSEELSIDDINSKDEEVVEENNESDCNNRLLAKDFFEEHVGIYDDYDIEESSIEIYEEDGDYAIIGNGFNPIYASSCICVYNEGEETVYLFKRTDSLGDTFYEIRVNDLSVMISYGDSEDGCNNVCGSFELRE
ncbi:MAG: hypothetical protein E7273_07450 [Pseudobutyrivibrio ruminis]|nr:hypothetical protein [Pseudobutyrivibrio ruminis]